MRNRPSAVVGGASGLVPAYSVSGLGGLLIASVLHRESVDSINIDRGLSGAQDYGDRRGCRPWPRQPSDSDAFLQRTQVSITTILRHAKHGAKPAQRLLRAWPSQRTPVPSAFPSGISPDGNAKVVFTPWPEDGVRTGLLGTRRSPPVLYMMATPAPCVHRTAFNSISLRRAPRPSPER